VFFEEFRDDPDHYSDRRYTHVIDPFEIPAGWRIYRSFDWGYSRPFSCGWWAVEGDGTAYRILELYGCTETPNEGVKWDPDRVFSEIARIESEHRWLRGKEIFGVADPAIWAAGTGLSVEEAAARHGVIFTKGDNSRIPGWLQMRYRLAFNEEGYPMMYVFKNCRAFIRTVPSLVFDEYRVEDLDTNGEDHVADETRYFCMSRPLPARTPSAADPFCASPQSVYLDIKKEDMVPHPSREKMEVLSEVV
ncbi:MAG: Terminase-like family protein, partial [Clostridia bacterium]|nr:Terminase-like family protein [Clostridia bacterium]